MSDFTGIAKYTYEISRRILESGCEFDITFFYGYYRKKLYAPKESGLSQEEISAKALKRIVVHSESLKRIARELIFFTSGLFSRRRDLYWEPNTVPIRPIGCKHLVATVHDFSFHVHPEWHPGERRDYFLKNFWKNIGRADRIITGSQFTKNEITGFLNREPSKIHVIYHGIDHDTFRLREGGELAPFAQKCNLPHAFILFVGSIEPRKNLLNALRAYNTLPADFKKDYKFVLAGFSGWNNKEVMDIVNREKGNIFYLGYLSDPDLASLYNLASVFIYPSWYEGFGLPPIEAMACGVPVVVSNTASMPEVCGDAAYYVDPGNIQSIAEGIFRVATGDIRADLIQKGLKQSQRYTWDQSAAAHLAVFNEVIRS